MASLVQTLDVCNGSSRGFIGAPCRSSLCSSSSFSSSCSGTRSSLVSRLDWVCGRLHSVGLLSNTCCRGTPSPALKSDILCRDTASFSWSVRGSSLLQGCLKKNKNKKTKGGYIWSKDTHVRMFLIFNFNDFGKYGAQVWVRGPVGETGVVAGSPKQNEK